MDDNDADDTKVKQPSVKGMSNMGHLGHFVKDKHMQAGHNTLVASSRQKAFSKNVDTEIKAGKKPNQAAAIAYSVQRKAGGKG